SPGQATFVCSGPVDVHPDTPAPTPPMSTSVLDFQDLPAPLSRPEELANSLTHGTGLALAIAGTGLLIERALAHGDALQIAGVVIYGATLVMLYAASTLS